MTGSDQPKKETVRTELPLPPATKPPEATVKLRETVRIQLPVRENGNPSISRSSSSAAASAGEDTSPTNFFQTPNAPAAFTRLSASVRPPSVSAAPGLKEETVRIPLMPERLHSSQKKSQPLIAMPQAAPQNPIAAGVAEKSSMLLYWVFLGVSALILIIQIWIYFS